MGSKQIFDHPEILDDGSPLLDLTEATKKLPGRRHSRGLLERAARRGCRGAVLKTFLLGNRRYTTENSLREWILAQQNVAPENSQTKPTKGTLSKKEIDEKAKKFRLPEPEDCSDGKTNR